MTIQVLAYSCHYLGRHTQVRRQEPAAMTMPRGPRTHLERSSGVRFSGLVVSVMPSFLSRFSMTGAKLRAPPFPAGHSLLNSAVSLCTSKKLSDESSLLAFPVAPDQSLLKALIFNTHGP